MQIKNRNVKKFIEAGKAFFTVRNKETGNRFSYRVFRSGKTHLGKIPPWFVWTRGSNGKYIYVGTIFEKKGFVTTSKSKVTEKDIRFQAFKWLYANAKKLPAKVEVFHEGKCCRCGKALTDPVSIEKGIGPICEKNYGWYWKGGSV